MNRKVAIFVLSTVAVFAASSCVKIDQDPIVQEAISFAPVAAKSTKAIISGNEYPTTESFKVSAFFEGTQTYFENLTASYSNPYWVTSTSEYWPLEGTLTFYSFSPASASGVSIDSTNGVTATGYTIQTSEQMTTDLCYASTIAIDCVAHPNQVPLQFSHALSQVVFRVKAADYYTTASNEVALALTSLSLNGINSVGNFANGTWSNQDSPRDYTISNTLTTLTYNNQTPVTTDVASYLFLPQELGANASLSVGYKIVQVARPSGQSYTLTNPPITIHLGDTITQWEPGKKYIYTLNIGMNNLITFTATAVGWQDDDYNIIVEEN